MEVIRKMEERSRGSCGRRVRVSSPKSLNRDVMESICKLLEEAQKSVQQMKSCLLGFKLEEEEDEADLVVLDHHSSLILNSFESLISMLKHSTHFNHSIQNAGIKQTRGCYKRRKSGESWSWETSDVVDDGHAWRKYGQKQILNTKYPRSYYRCTHKEDEKCEARKQVQQTSENPRKYSIIYHGLHTCKNNNSQNPSKLLSFQITPTTTTLYPAMISSSTFHNHNHNHNHNPNPTEYSSMKDDHQLISAESETNYLELQYSSSDTHNHIIPSELCTTLSSPVSDDHHAISDFDDFFNFINIHQYHYTATA